MNKPDHSPDQIHERAALYVLGAMDNAEAADFAAHLAQGCQLCADEVAAFARVAGELPYSVDPRAPQKTLRQRVLSRISVEATSNPSATLRQEGLTFVQPQRFEWQPLPAPGLEIKLLSADARRGSTTQLVRMRPGAAYPSHRHADVEELFLLEGDLLVSGVLMRAGDYCRAEPESVHAGISSPSGCVFISTASVRDELLA
ncbi:MAG: cupin domain-containing protein [Deltaproteobacteria bacterium]|nr:cupin domain-containing protein [Deltaproteobacteria bacterium]